MADLRVAGFVPGDPGEVVFRFEVEEADVPQERAEGLDRVDFVALGAQETQPQTLVRVGGKAWLAVGHIVVAGVMERGEPRITLGHGAAEYGLSSVRRRVGGATGGSTLLTPPMLPNNCCTCQRQAASRLSSTPPST